MVNQRSRKPGRKAPLRVQELAARGEDTPGDTAELAAEASGAGGDDEAAEVATSDAPDGEEVAASCDAPAGDEVAATSDAPDGEEVAATESVREDDVSAGPGEAASAADLDADDAADAARGVDDGASVPEGVGEAAAAAGPGAEDEGGPASDPLTDMLAEFDAPRPVVQPGVQLSEEIPIDPEDDLRAVEGEASLRLVSILESLLFAAAKPLKVQDLRKVLAETTKHQVQLALKHLMAVTAQRGVVLAQVAGGFQFRTHPENAVWVQKMLQSKPARLSRTQIETLAIVAYRQPITRPEIDDVRGVDSGAVLKLLLERELIQIVGKKEEPGRPLLYGTTVRFLEFFNLRSLRDMPTLRDFRDLSEESKATLRARLGESEAEALGQGVLGLDLSAGPKARVEGTGEEEGEDEASEDESGQDDAEGPDAGGGDSEEGASEDASGAEEPRSEPAAELRSDDGDASADGEAESADAEAESADAEAASAEADAESPGADDSEVATDAEVEGAAEATGDDATDAEVEGAAGTTGDDATDAEDDATDAEVEGAAGTTGGDATDAEDDATDAEVETTGHDATDVEVEDTGGTTIDEATDVEVEDAGGDVVVASVDDPREDVDAVAASTAEVDAVGEDVAEDEVAARAREAEEQLRESGAEFADESGAREVDDDVDVEPVASPAERTADGTQQDAAEAGLPGDAGPEVAETGADVLPAAPTSDDDER